MLGRILSHLLERVVVFLLGFLFDRLLPSTMQEATAIIPDNPAEMVRAIVVATAFTIIFYKLLDISYWNQNRKFCSHSKQVKDCLKLVLYSTERNFASDEIRFKVGTLYSEVLHPFEIPSPLPPPKPLGEFDLGFALRGGENFPRQEWLKFLHMLYGSMNDSRLGLRGARGIYPLMKEEWKKELLREIHAKESNDAE